MEFENSNKLKGYLRGEKERLNVHSNYIYGMYFIRKILEKIYNDYPEDFTLKGSISQFANTDDLIRPLTDIDTVSQNSIDDSYSKIRKALLNERGEIDYKIIDEFLTSRKTLSIKIMCNFEKIEKMIKLDLKRENSFYKIKGPFNKILLKDKIILVNYIPIENHIANKAYVILLNISNFYNSKKQLRRSKDLYDLYKLLENNKYNLDLVKSYFKNNLELYGGIDFSKVKRFEFDPDFIYQEKESYIKEADKLEFKDEIPFDEVLDKVVDVRKKMGI